MNCYQHSDQVATAFCRSCGRALCTACQMRANGTVFCPEHAPVGASATADSGASNPYVGSPGTAPIAQSTGVQTSPGLAFLLGLIPGVGAIYNAQYVKGLVHALIFGLLMSLADATEGTAGHPFLIILSVVFYFYMPFEAYHTARKRQAGLPVDEWSSVISSEHFSSRAPAFPIVLIVIGVLFLLDSLHIIPFREVGRFWPVLLIVVGALMLNSRLAIRVGKRPVTSKEQNTWEQAAASDVAAGTSHER